MSAPLRDLLVGAPRLVALAASFACAATSGRAHAMSCTDHAYEKMNLERTGVFVGTRAVAPPPELGAIDELVNSGADGKGVLLWGKATGEFGKFYDLVEAWTPDPAIQPWLTAVSRRRLSTACGYSVAYTPVLPGSYEFDQEQLRGERRSKGIDDPVVLVAPGRDRVELRFSLRGRRYRAEYAVQCAYFDWERGVAKQCAQSVASPWPASVAPPDEPPESAPSPSATARTSAAPAPGISVVSLPIDAPGSTSTDPRNGRGCGSCAVGAPTAQLPGAWTFILGCGILHRCGRRRRLARSVVP